MMRRFGRRCNSSLDEIVCWLIHRLRGTEPGKCQEESSSVHMVVHSGSWPALQEGLSGGTAIAD